MAEQNAAEVRDRFFRRTRMAAAIMYAVWLGLVASFVVATWLAWDNGGRTAQLTAVVAGIVAVAVMTLASVFGVRHPSTAEASRVLIGVGVAVGVASSFFLDAIPPDWRVVVWSSFAGATSAGAVGFFFVRRRLFRHPEILVEGRERGFDPDRPFWSVLHGRSRR